MALENEKKVRFGDRLRIPASTWNSLIDLLRWWKRNRGRMGGGIVTDAIHPHNTILIKNYSGKNLDTGFKVLRVQEAIYSIQDDSYKFAKRPAMGGYIPQAKTDAIALTLAPGLGIAPEGSGSDGSGSGGDADFEPDIIRAVISGYTIAFVKLKDVLHEWANPVNGVIDYLESDQRGQVRIIYWEPIDIVGSDGSVSYEGSTGFPEDVVIAVVHLIGVNTDNTVLWGRDNFSEACDSYDDSVRFDYYNSDTSPGNSFFYHKRQVLWFPGTLTGAYGPQCYIPEGTGRVVIDAAVQLTVLPMISFISAGENKGIMFDFSFDLVSVDYHGNLKAIDLYDEDGNLEMRQTDGPSSDSFDWELHGLTDDHQILSGQYMAMSNGESRYFGDYSILYGFCKRQTLRTSFHIGDTPIRLGLRVNPTASYLGYYYIGSYNDILLKWFPHLGVDYNRGGKPTFINYTRVQKDRNFCSVGPIDYGYGASGFEGSVGSVPEGSPPGSHPDNLTVDITTTLPPGSYAHPIQIRSTVSISNAPPASPPFLITVDWGDGTSDTISSSSLVNNINHFYNVAGGPYTITATVVDTNGNSGSDSIGTFTIT